MEVGVKGPSASLLDHVSLVCWCFWVLWFCGFVVLWFVVLWFCGFGCCLLFAAIKKVGKVCSLLVPSFYLPSLRFLGPFMIALPEVLVGFEKNKKPKGTPISRSFGLTVLCRFPGASSQVSGNWRGWLGFGFEPNLVAKLGGPKL